MSILANKLVTADELLAMGTDFHGELVRGRLIEMAPASWGHGDWGNSAAYLITTFVRKHRLGKVFTAETGFILSREPDTVRAPDVAFVRAERIPKNDDGSGFFKGPPDLAVEILSPNDRYNEVVEKVEDYLTAGTLEVWLIDPKRKTIEVHSAKGLKKFAEADLLLSESALPEFSVGVAEFFSES